MLRDAEHFKTRIGGLDGAGDAGDYIVNLVKGKSVLVAKVPAPDPMPVAINGKTSSESASEVKVEGEKTEVKEEPKVENEKL